jgi:glycosyltransferase involved in cell wall biosynthesis
MSTISVVVPVYNRQHLIIETLVSIERQQRLPDEVIVVDDGSTDDSVAMVRRFAKRSRLPVRLMNNRGCKGVSGATNCGIKAARGEFIALLDSDDLWTPCHLDQLLRALERYPRVDMAFSAVEVFGDASDVADKTAEFSASVEQCLAAAFDRATDGLWVSNSSLLFTLLWWGVPFRCPASLARRSLYFDNQLFFDENIRYTQDAQLMTMAAFFSPFIYVDTTGFLLRRHQENDRDIRYSDDVFRSYDARVVQLKQFFRNRQLNGLERKALRRRLAQMQSWTMMLRSRDRSLLWKVSECWTMLKRVPSLYALKTAASVAYHNWLRSDS